jgi:hypothetical protein
VWFLQQLVELHTRLLHTLRIRTVCVCVCMCVLVPSYVSLYVCVCVYVSFSMCVCVCGSSSSWLSSTPVSSTRSGSALRISNIGVTIMLHCCYDGAIVVLQWWYSGVVELHTRLLNTPRIRTAQDQCDNSLIIVQ